MTALGEMTPFNFKKWIEENRHLLKPPVCNVQIWQDREFMITVVGGPNARSDYHINEGEEFFYQLEGNIILKILDPLGKPKDLRIQEGDIFLLPPKIPHSPQRPAKSVGLVIERKRTLHEKDGFLWICTQCGEKLHEEYIHLIDIVKQLPPVFDRFYSNDACCVCRRCGARARKD